jgi:hypothetical protein
MFRLSEPVRLSDHKLTAIRAGLAYCLRPYSVYPWTVAIGDVRDLEAAPTPPKSEIKNCIVSLVSQPFRETKGQSDLGGRGVRRGFGVDVGVAVGVAVA